MHFSPITPTLDYAVGKFHCKGVQVFPPALSTHILYSRKYWQFGPEWQKEIWQYGTISSYVHVYMRVHVTEKYWQVLILGVVGVNCQTAKFNSPPNFPAICYLC